ncbi:hypothetical protein PC116_g30053 [Phytophthora cactorum]|nr:hypothetical protein PC116_g30053 [Phytophthora cactorum]
MASLQFPEPAGTIRAIQQLPAPATGLRLVRIYAPETER